MGEEREKGEETARRAKLGGKGKEEKARKKAEEKARAKAKRGGKKSKRAGKDTRESKAA